MDEEALRASDEEQVYLNIRADAEIAAGSLNSLRLRARSYLSIYHASDGACRFALIAAYGALWASWYLICGRFAALFFTLADPTSRWAPRARYNHFCAYVEVLKEINAMVMVETYVLVHTLKRLGPDFAIRKGIPRELANDYARAIAGEERDDQFLKSLYHRHFLWEQERVVSTKLEDAFNAFGWPLMRDLCQRPWVWFSYFHLGKSMNFKRFTDPEERIEKGMMAYDRATEFGFGELFTRTHSRLQLAARIGL